MFNSDPHIARFPPLFCPGGLRTRFRKFCPGKFSGPKGANSSRCRSAPVGKKARELRSAVKTFARSLGYRETELGELKATVSKAEARRRFLRWKWDLSFMVVESARELRELYVKNRLAIQLELVASLGEAISKENDCAILV
jgi:hypothetical protein